MLSSQLANAYFAGHEVTLPPGDDIEECGQGVLDGTYAAYVHFDSTPVKQGLRTINTGIVSGVPIWVAADSDQDQDVTPDYLDNCPNSLNADQADSDGDGIGDVYFATTDLSSGLTPADLVNTLLGGGVTISHVTYIGSNEAAGMFKGHSGIAGFTNGIILSSGKIADAVGPNRLFNTTTRFNTPGDTNLNSLSSGFSTLDAAVLEFDFIPTTDQVTFQYVFGSEEYNE